MSRSRSRDRSVSGIFALNGCVRRFLRVAGTLLAPLGSDRSGAARRRVTSAALETDAPQAPARYHSPTLDMDAHGSGGRQCLTLLQ